MKNKHRVFLLAWIVCWNGMYGLEAAALETTENSAASPLDNGIVVRAMQYCQGLMFGARRDEMPLGMNHGSSPTVCVSLSDSRISSLRRSRATSAQTLVSVLALLVRPTQTVAQAISTPAPARAPTYHPVPVGSGCSQKPSKVSCPSSITCPGKNLMHKNGPVCETACVAPCNVASKKKAGCECG
jgi:hypothetical protein